MQPTLLAFDTATDACSVAVLHNNKIHQEFAVIPRQHSEKILPLIDALLTKLNLTLQQLDAIVFGQGPGSFMGIRLAASVAQGLALGATKPTMGISTLQALAQTAFAATGEKNILAAWDARIQEMYWGAYQVDDQGLMQPVVADQLSKPDAINFTTEKSWLAVGNAWEVYRAQLPSDVQQCIHFSETLFYPQASALLTLGLAKFKAGNLHSSIALPVYLRDKVTHE